MRTYFSYDPVEDRHAPCPEAGLKFERGKILCVLNQDDPDWWQAVYEGEERIQAGIIPSKVLRERLVGEEGGSEGEKEERGRVEGDR